MFGTAALHVWASLDEVQVLTDILTEVIETKNNVKTIASPFPIITLTLHVNFNILLVTFRFDCQLLRVCQLLPVCHLCTVS